MTRVVRHVRVDRVIVHGVDARHHDPAELRVLMEAAVAREIATSPALAADVARAVTNGVTRAVGGGEARG